MGDRERDKVMDIRSSIFGDVVRECDLVGRGER